MGKQARKSVFLIAEQLRAKVPGGIGTHTSALLSAVSRLKGDFPNLEFRVIASSQKGRDPLDQFDIPVRRLPFGHEVFMRLSDAKIPFMGRGPGVYHSFSMLVPPVLMKSQKQVCTVHDVAFLSNPSFFTKRGVLWHTRQLRTIAKGGFPIVAVSERTKQSLSASGIDHDRVTVIESGADHLGNADLKGCEALMQSLGIGQGFILSVSTLEPRKNLNGLIAAYRQMRISNSSAPDLLIVGPSGWGERTEGEAGVHFLGNVSEQILVALYQSALFLTYVPFEEGFGLPVVEAMSNGLPVVSSDVPSAKGAVELVDPKSVESISAGMSRLIVDGQRRRVLMQQGLDRAAQLTWAGAARKHMELWERMLWQSKA